MERHWKSFVLFSWERLHFDAILNYVVLSKWVNLEAEMSHCSFSMKYSQNVAL